MADSYGFAAPIVPGKTQALRNFVKEAQGPRRADHTESRERMNLTNERVFHQTTPKGELAVIFVEGPGAKTVTKRLAESTHPYDKWFREQIAEIHGLDFDTMTPPPLAERVFAWDGQGPATTATAFCVPLEKVAEWKKMVAEMAGPRKTEHAEARRALGISKEHVFFLPTPMGDMAVVYLEGKDVSTFIDRVRKSDQPFDRWFTERITDVHGIDWSKPMPQNEELLHWTKEKVGAR